MNKEKFYNIAVIGAGYVGLVTGSCLASLGHTVYCVDIDINKIKKLQLGEVYIHEPGLSELIIEQIKLKRLIFTDNLELAVDAAEVFFIAVGTPQHKNGRANLTFVRNAILQLTSLFKPNDYKLIIIKSTVPVGTCRSIYNKINKLKPNLIIDVVSNPEFLREGSAIFDFMHPDRIIVGINNNSSHKQRTSVMLHNIYRYFIDRNVPLLENDLESSELIKYASNCFLATKIAFINELADFCVQVNNKLHSNLDILKVAYAIGLDPRIGSKFLQPGPGFGGSCFPKDTLALDYSAKQYNTKLSILNAAIVANQTRIYGLSNKIINICKYNNINKIHNKVIAILGIAFKANTDDIRDSPAIEVINDLHRQGAVLNIYDPKAIANGKQLFKKLKNINWLDNAYAAISNAELIVVLTEWPEFVDLDLRQVKHLMKPNYLIIIDFRNLFNPVLMQQLGIHYYSMANGLL